MTNHPNRGKLSRNALELIAKLSAGGIALDRDQQEAIGAICRNGASYKRMQEDRCNGPSWANIPGVAGLHWDSWEATLSKREAECIRRIQHYVDRLPAIVVKPVFQGDPRGITVKLRLVDRLTHLHDAFDRSGLCVPGS